MTNLRREIDEGSLSASGSPWGAQRRDELVELHSDQQSNA